MSYYIKIINRNYTSYYMVAYLVPAISISFPSDLLNKIDEYTREYEYTGRSEPIREALRASFTEIS